MPRCLGRGGVPGGGLGPGAITPQHGGQPGGQGYHSGVLAGSGGHVQAGEQVRAFRANPGQRLSDVLQNRNPASRRGR